VWGKTLKNYDPQESLGAEYPSEKNTGKLEENIF